MELPKEMPKKLPKKLPRRCMIIGYVWPELHSSAAGIRTWNLVESLLEAGWQVAFGSVSKVNTYTVQLESRGVRTFSLRMNHSSFDALVVELAPDLVIFDRFVVEEQFGWRVREICPQAVRVVDTQDLHFLRRTRARAIQKGIPLPAFSKTGEPSIELDSESMADLVREIGSIRRCDLALVLSDFERDLLVSGYGISHERLMLSRFHYPVATQSKLDFDERCDVGMIGNFRHPPNADGVCWFASAIWPQIRKHLPGLRMHVYGAYPSREMMDLSDAERGFLVHGPLPGEQLFSTLEKLRVNCAPLRFGAGIKGKITDGWSSGTPVVTTSIGAEGMSGELPWGGLIAEEPREFADAVVKLVTDSGLWSECQTKGYEILNRLYSKKENSTQLVDRFEDLVQRRKAGLPKALFSDTLLEHHLFQGSKYFSKWIEAKESAKTQVC